MKPVTNRICVFLFGIAVAILGLINPDKTIQSIAQIFSEW